MNAALSHFGFMEQIAKIADAGFDCVELRIDEFMTFDNERFKKMERAVGESGLNTNVQANPVPLDAFIASPDFKLDDCRERLKEVMFRCAKLGAKYIVYGNSRSRRIPEGPEREAGIKKNEEVVSMLCDSALPYNITILLEPLGRAITNNINSISEACEYINKIGRPNLQTMLDYRWYVEDGNPLDDLIKYADLVKHIHIDNPLIKFPERRGPALNDGFDYSCLFTTLRQIDYKGIISVEANTFDDFSADLRKSLELFAHFGFIPKQK